MNEQVIMELKDLNLELFADCSSTDEVLYLVTKQVDDYVGRAVNSLSEALDAFCDGDGCHCDTDDMHCGEQITRCFMLNNESATVRVCITEICADYPENCNIESCYLVEVNEVYE